MPYTYHNFGHHHPELGNIERAIHRHIGWAVNGKDRQQLYSSLADNEELFFFQPGSQGPVRGIEQFRGEVEGFFMRDDFRALSYQLHQLRINLSPSLRTAWFSCLLDDFNTFQGRPANWEKVRWTGVLEKVDGAWRIFQMHFSRSEAPAAGKEVNAGDPDGGQKQ
jgi:ketosteroid isomerase-like protein